MTRGFSPSYRREGAETNYDSPNRFLRNLAQNHMEIYLKDSDVRFSSVPAKHRNMMGAVVDLTRHMLEIGQLLRI